MTEQTKECDKKTFTQEELNTIIQKRLAREKNKVQYLKNKLLKNGDVDYEK